MVRERGVEPLRSYPLDPKSSASASSATLAKKFTTLTNGEIYNFYRLILYIIIDIIYKLLFYFWPNNENIF